MYLHANEKTIGVKNFNAALGNRLIRRGILREMLQRRFRG